MGGESNMVNLKAFLWSTVAALGERRTCLSSVPNAAERFKNTRFRPDTNDWGSVE